MSEAPLMLGVSGLRGIVGRSLTPEVAARFAGAVGAWIRQRVERTALDPRRTPTVCLARDGRVGGEAIMNVAAMGLAMSGCDVHVLGVIATPTLGVFLNSPNFDGRP